MEGYTQASNLFKSVNYGNFSGNLGRRSSAGPRRRSRRAASKSE